MRRNLTFAGAPLLLAILVFAAGGCASQAPPPPVPSVVQPCSPPPCEPQPDNPCNWPDYKPDGQQETADALLNEILLAAQTANEQGMIDPGDWLRISLRVPACRAPDLSNKMGVQVCAVVDPRAYDELLGIRDQALAIEASGGGDAPPKVKAASQGRWFTLAEELDSFPKGN